MEDFLTDVYKFQSTLPREERLTCRVLCRVFVVFQSTLPREERRQGWKSDRKHRKISIHAPTRGATMVVTFKLTTSEFQSTLPREERRLVVTERSGYNDFNPRSHERSDRRPGQTARINNISIHAPTRGATNGYGVTTAINQFQSTLPREERRRPGKVQAHPLRFQSTLPREERPFRAFVLLINQSFQSTLPREERLYIAPSRYSTADFNPRSHERSDAILHKKFVYFYTIPTINI